MRVSIFKYLKPFVRFGSLGSVGEELDLIDNSEIEANWLVHSANIALQRDPDMGLPFGTNGTARPDPT